MKGKIPISAAREVSGRHGCSIVIIFGLEAGGDRFTVTTYGTSKALCRHAASLADQIAEAILHGTITPAAREPAQLPDSPTEWDGRGRAGEGRPS
jgi:hypothetical protein